jgi:ribosomal protein L34E
MWPKGDFTGKAKEGVNLRSPDQQSTFSTHEKKRAPKRPQGGVKTAEPGTAAFHRLGQL